jgi:hypothetical protein
MPKENDLFCSESCQEKWEEEYKEWLDAINDNRLEAEGLLADNDGG